MGFVVNKLALRNFFSRPVYMGFVVNKVALGHFFLGQYTWDLW